MGNRRMCRLSSACLFHLSELDDKRQHWENAHKPHFSWTWASVGLQRLPGWGTQPCKSEKAHMLQWTGQGFRHAQKVMTYPNYMEVIKAGVWLKSKESWGWHVTGSRDWNDFKNLVESEKESVCSSYPLLFWPQSALHLLMVTSESYPSPWLEQCVTCMSVDPGKPLNEPEIWERPGCSLPYLPGVCCEHSAICPTHSSTANLK